MMKHIGHFKKADQGFTIVELLIVIVVIAILAAITIVAYNGISSRTRQSAMQSNLQQLQTLVANYKTVNGAYPAALSDLNDGRGVQKSEDELLVYTLEGSDDYCLTIGSTASSDTYYTCGSIGTIKAGTYSGHVGLLAGFPSRDGFTDISTATGPNDTLQASTGSIATGSWMVVILAYTNNSDPTPPAGWTTLVTRKTTNTMQTSIYAKIKQSGDDDIQAFDAGGTNGEPTTNGVIFWGRNSAPISSWVLGSFGDRSTNATATTAVTPTMSITTSKTLVLSIATERTMAAETNYVSLAGATPWVWVPQPAAYPNKMQTITVGYNEQSNPGTSQAMTVTYPNSQTYNATGVQLAIPSAS